MTGRGGGWRGVGRREGGREGARAGGRLRAAATAGGGCVEVEAPPTLSRARANIPARPGPAQVPLPLPRAGVHLPPPEHALAAANYQVACRASPPLSLALPSLSPLPAPPTPPPLYLAAL